MIPFLCFILITSTQPEQMKNARSALDQGDYSTAIRVYTQLLNEQPELYEARFGLARAYAFSGQYTKSIELYSRLLQDNPDDVDSLLGRGRVYAWQKEYNLAVNDLRSVVQQSPDYADAWSALGDVYLWGGRNNEAIDAYTQWISLQPDNPQSYLAKARAVIQTGHIQEAKSALQKAQQRDGDPDIIRELARQIEALEHPQEMEFAWKVGFTYDFLEFAPSTTQWQTYTSFVQHTFEHGSVSLESIETKRFSQWDDAVAIDTYFDLWDKAYANVRFQLTSHADILAKWDGSLELYQGWGDGWEASASYRHMDFQNNNVDLYGIGLARYLGDWYLREKTTLTTESGNLDVSQSFLLRRYLVSSDHYIQFLGGFGDEVVTLGAGPQVEARSTYFVSLGGQTHITRHWGLFLNLLYQDIDQTPIRRGFTTGITYRW